MQGSTDWLLILVLFSCLLGLIVALILYFVNRNASFSPRVLAVILCCLAIVLLAGGLTFSGQYMNFPHFWRVAVPFSLSVCPLAYIYVRSVLEQQFRFRRWDFLLFLPAIAYTLQFVPVYFAPLEVKLKVMRAAIEDETRYAAEPEGLLPEGWGIILRQFFNLAVLGFTYRLLLLWRKRINRPGQASAKNTEIYRWLVYLTLVLSSTTFILLFEYLFRISRFFDLYRAISLTLSGTIVFITVYLLVKPYILYGLEGWLQEPEDALLSVDQVPGSEPNIPAPAKGGTPVIAKPEQQAIPHMPAGQRRDTLTREQRARYLEAISCHFRENAPFVKPGYAIRDLSMQLDIPGYQLSAFINQEFGKNFNEFVNDARVDYLLSQVSDAVDPRQFTLEALGQSVGFRSRTAFIAAVKRKTGKTPSELLYGKGGA
jgi:AraC-like DNA-binding protein